MKNKIYFFYFSLLSLLTFFYLFPRFLFPLGISYLFYLVIKPVRVKVLFGTMRSRVLYTCFVASLVALVSIPLVGFLFEIDDNLSTILSQAPRIRVLFYEGYFKLQSFLHLKVGINLSSDPMRLMASQIERYGESLVGFIPTLVSSLFEWIILIPLFSYFFFKESEEIYERSLQLIPNSLFEKFYVLTSQFNKKFSEYIFAKFIEAVILGFFVSVGLWIIGFPHAFSLGFFAGLTNILPYLGPFLGYLPAFLIVALSPGENIGYGGVTLIYVLANMIDLFFVFPFLVSRIVNLHPLIVMMSIIVGSQVGGILGMIVIIPVVAFVKIMLKEIYQDVSIYR